MPVKTLTAQLISMYIKLRPFIVAVFVIFVSLAPAIPDPKYKNAVTIALLLALVAIAFDIYRELQSRLTSIEKYLAEPEPPTFDTFTAALPDIERSITSRLNANQDVRIRMLTVTAQFSWKLLIEDKLSDFLELGNKSPRISIELVITKPQMLDNWQQKKLKVDAQRTLDGIKVFEGKYAEELERGRLSLDIYLYDNIPHWHGVLVDNDTFFMGRAKWIIKGDDLELTVGQNKYRKFERNDRFRGTDRVVLFENWFEAYKLRSKAMFKYE